MKNFSAFLVLSEEESRFVLNLFSGTVILDAEEEVLPEIATRVTDQLIEDNQIDNYSRNAVKWAFKLRHRYY